MAQVRDKKLADKKKIAGGSSVLMPEVFVSNYSKQQKNFAKYKREKNLQKDFEHVANPQVLSLAQGHTVPVDSLVLVLRVQESRNTTPQAQKILKELGLKEVNNAAFVMATTETIKQLMLVKDYVAYGLPSKAVLEDLIRKRGFLKAKNSKRVPISDNVMIEELLGEDGCICVEDVIDSFWRCKQNAALYKRVKEVLWPI